MGLLTDQILEALYGLKIQDEAGQWHIYAEDGNEITHEFGVVGRGKMAALLFWPKYLSTHDLFSGAGAAGSRDEPETTKNSYTATAGTAVAGGYRRNKKKDQGFIDWSRILEPLPPGAWEGERSPEQSGTGGVEAAEEADKLHSQQLLQAVERVERLPGSQPLAAPGLQISPIAAAKAVAEFDDEEALIMLLLEI